MNRRLDREDKEREERERERRIEAERDRKQQEAALQAARHRAAVERERELRRREEYRQKLLKEAERRRAGETRARFDPIWRDDKQMICLDEILEASAAAAAVGVADKQEIRAGIVRLAHAQGARGTRSRALELAGALIAFANGIPKLNVRDAEVPDLDRVELDEAA